MRRRLISILSAVGGIVSTIVIANLFFFWCVNQVVRYDILSEASRWSAFIAEDIPNADAALESGNLSAPQENAIRILLRQSEISRLEIEDITTGQRALVRQLQPHVGFTPAALNEAQRLDVLEGEMVYETYLPESLEGMEPQKFASVATLLRSSDGSPMAIAHFYVNLDETASTLVSYSRWVSFIMTIGFTVVLTLLAVKMLRSRGDAETSHARLQYLARHDPLTDLYNRGGFEERWQHDQEENAANTRGTALLFIDIDRFKQVNDSFSHAAGDAYIRYIGSVIHNSIGRNDFAGRLGGDEYAAVVYCDSREEAEAMAAKICERSARPTQTQGMKIVGSVSIGIHYSEERPTLLQDRMKMADFALYQAKADGRATYRNFSEELATKSRRRHKVENILRRALQNDYFYLVYQPKIDAKSRACTGFEALLRMQDQNGELIMPGEFIPLMESMGIAEEVGAWVLNTATKAARNWPSEISIAVNLSVRQMTSEKLVETVSNALNESGLDPHRLELEVTESLLIENPESAERELAQLRNMGISVSIDDFGTGYSSLGYLWRFGFDKIKIDRSFVIGLTENRAKSLDILETMIMLGHRLGMQMIVEGVEMEEQVELLGKLGIDSYQGFFFSRPMPEIEIEDYLTSFQTPGFDKTATA